MTSNMSIIDKWDYVIHELADKRTADWPMVSAWCLPAVLSIYLWLIYSWGPKFMEKRDPYNLKWIIAAYNAIQVFSCLGLIYGIATSGWTTTYTMGCQPVDFSNKPEAVRMAGMVWYTLVLKYMELIETVFFVLRKKQNQVSFLHVYHHVSTLSLTWVGVKYVPGGMITFSIMLNCFIHMLMYTYYLLTLAGPVMQRRLSWWKKTLTILQMVQFVIILVHTMQGLSPTCPIPRLLVLMFLPNVVLIFYMFNDFYKKAYTKPNALKEQ